MSSLFCLNASASSVYSFNFFTLFGADTASFGRLEFAGSSLRYRKPNCAMPPPFSAKVGIERLPLSAMLVAARLIADAACPLRLVVSTPAFCNPREATVISQPSSFSDRGELVCLRANPLPAGYNTLGQPLDVISVCGHQAWLASIFASLCQVVSWVQYMYQQMIPILLNILRRMDSPHVLGAAAPINLEVMMIHISFALASHIAEAPRLVREQQRN